MGRCVDTSKLSVQFFYGDTRMRTIPNFANASSPDIVITTYSTLASDFSNIEHSPLYQIHWHRVVLDEAHLIKEKSTISAKACYKLEASFRWAVTGTPIVNKLDDIFSLIHFLRIEPWSQYSFWNAFVTLPFENHDASAIDVVQTIMEPLVLRRTKDMKDDAGNPIVDLPPKTVNTEYLDFDIAEREIYDGLQKLSKRKLSRLKQIGKASYVHVFQLLTQMRQICDHPLLLKSNTESSSSDEIVEIETVMANYKDKYAIHLGDALENAKDRECPICFEISGDNVLLPCLHILCNPCLDLLLERLEQVSIEIGREQEKCLEW